MLCDIEVSVNIICVHGSLCYLAVLTMIIDNFTAHLLQLVIYWMCVNLVLFLYCFSKSFMNLYRNFWLFSGVFMPVFLLVEATTVLWTY